MAKTWILIGKIRKDTKSNKVLKHTLQDLVAEMV